MNKYLFAILACVVALTTACDDRDDELTSIDYARPFSPTGIEARVQNNVNVRLTWTAMSDDATYNIEVYKEESLSYSFSGSPVFEVKGLTTNTYTIENLEGDETFSAYVKSVVDGVESVYKGVSFETGGEQHVLGVEVVGSIATIYWEEEVSVDTITFKGTGTTRKYALADDVDSGSCTYTYTNDDNEEVSVPALYFTTPSGDLKGEMEYTATLKYGEKKTMGTATFTTDYDLSGDGVITFNSDEDFASAVESAEGVKNYINSLEDGTTLVFYPGTYDFNEAITIDKDITITAASNQYTGDDMPFLQFGTSSAGFTMSGVGSLAIKGCKIEGGNEETVHDGYFIQISSSAAAGDITLQDCEIYNIGRGLIYNSNEAEAGNITVKNCFCHEIDTQSNGGAIDLRKLGFMSLTLQNSTFANCALKREFIRIDDNSSSFSYAPTLLVDHCTVEHAVEESGQKYFARCMYQGATFTWTNNLVTNCATETPNGFASKPDTDPQPVEISFDGNYYYNSPYLVSTEGFTGAYIDTKGKKLEESPYVDPENGDFTIVDNEANEDIIYYGVGDPRWIK